MRQLRGGNRKRIKEHNRILVINHLRLHGPMSRADLARYTELGLSTITYIIDELMDDGLVVETGAGESSGGRKPTMLEFNGSVAAVVGIKIEPTRILFSRMNLLGKIQQKAAAELPPEADSAALNQLLIDNISGLLEGDVNSAPLVGIGIAVSGLVDQAHGKVLYSPILAWDEFDFTPVSRHFDVPVIVENDANTFALAQVWTGMVPHHSSFLGVTVGVGVGLGIVIDGQVFRGEHGGAGEFGHLVIQHEGAPCYCGQRGCLEMYASDHFVLSEVKRHIALGVPTILGDSDSLTINDVYEAAEQGDRCAQSIIYKQGQNLGIGLKNLVNLFNPAAIILGGEGIRGGKHLLRGIELELATNFFAKKQQPVQLKVCSTGEDVWLIGTCALVVNQIYRAPIFKRGD
ncbi:MAG: ROK family protein [Limnochordia bacterium]